MLLRPTHPIPECQVGQSILLGPPEVMRTPALVVARGGWGVYNTRDVASSETDGFFARPSRRHGFGATISPADVSKEH